MARASATSTTTASLASRPRTKVTRQSAQASVCWSSQSSQLIEIVALAGPVTAPSLGLIVSRCHQGARRVCHRLSARSGLRFSQDLDAAPVPAPPALDLDDLFGQDLFLLDGQLPA